MRNLRESWLVEVPALQIIRPDQLGIPDSCSEISCIEKSEFYTIVRVGGIRTLLTYCLEHGLAVDEVFGADVFSVRVHQ